MRGLPFAAALLIVAISTSIAARPAPADHLGIDIPWPPLLAAGPGPTDVQPVPVPRCKRATIRCEVQLVRHIRRQWKRLDRACDHRAVATLAYLRINEELLTELRKPDSIFRHKRWFYRVITDFSNRYFSELRGWQRGEPITEAWQIAFDGWASGEIGGGQDVLLFSNAHVQHDLPFVYAKMGQRTPEGRSRKHDHDVFNEINNRIMDGVGDEITQRYDPFFALTDLSPLPLDEFGSIEVVKMWRERSWRNGERLLRAGSAAERRQIHAEIDQEAAGWARMIASFEFDGYREMRDEHCRAFHAEHPPG